MSDNLLFDDVRVKKLLCNYHKLPVLFVTPQWLKTQELLIPLFLSYAVYADLWKTGMFERMSLQTDEDEHSIEMHLPYTAKAMER